MSWAATMVATITQFSDQFNLRIISQLFKGISIVLQKLLRYFNGIIVSTFFVVLSSVWPVICSFVLGELLSTLPSLKPVISTLSAKPV